MMTQKDLDEAIREEQREYTRQYRRKHPDKVREWNRNYWTRKVEQRKREQQED